MIDMGHGPISREALYIMENVSDWVRSPDHPVVAGDWSMSVASEEMG